MWEGNKMWASMSASPSGHDLCWHTGSQPRQTPRLPSPNLQRVSESEGGNCPCLPCPSWWPLLPALSRVVTDTTDTRKMQDPRLSERKETVGLQVSKNNFKIFFIFLVFRQRLSTGGIPVSVTIPVFLSSNHRSPDLVTSWSRCSRARCGLWAVPAALGPVSFSHLRYFPSRQLLATLKCHVVRVVFHSTLLKIQSPTSCPFPCFISP